MIDSQVNGRMTLSLASFSLEAMPWRFLKKFLALLLSANVWFVQLQNFLGSLLFFLVGSSETNVYVDYELIHVIIIAKNNNNIIKDRLPNPNNHSQKLWVLYVMMKVRIWRETSKRHQSKLQNLLWVSALSTNLHHCTRSCRKKSFKWI